MRLLCSIFKSASCHPLLCRSLLPLVAVLCWLPISQAQTAETPEQANAEIAKVLADTGLDGTAKGVPGQIAAAGITRQETRIPAVIGAGDLNAFESPSRRILLVAGLDGKSASISAGLAAYRWFETSPEAASLRRQFTLSLIPVGNPDGFLAGTGPKNSSGGNPTLGYPPAEPAYQSPTDPEAQYLWRWIGLHGPDLVVVFHSADKLSWQIATEDLPVQAELARVLENHTLPPAGSLVDALSKNKPADVDTIPAMACGVTTDDGPQVM